MEKDTLIAVRDFDGKTVTLEVEPGMELEPGTKLALYACAVTSQSSMLQPLWATVEVTSVKTSSIKSKGLGQNDSQSLEKVAVQAVVLELAELEKSESDDIKLPTKTPSKTERMNAHPPTDVLAKILN